MLMLTKNFEPLLPAHYVICGNYTDCHMEAKFIAEDGNPAPPKKGFKASVQYDIALWGDKGVTREQVVEIGKQSIKAGRLVLSRD